MIWILLILFQLKHFIADYPLQNEYMLGKFKNTGWIKPLSAHCGVQAMFTYLIAVFALPNAPKSVGVALGLAALDFSIHFTMDRIKASPKMLGRYESISKDQYRGLIESQKLAQSGADYIIVPELVGESKRILKEIEGKFKSNKYFWWSLGFDQMIHHLTDVLIVFLIVKAAGEL